MPVLVFSSCPCLFQVTLILRHLWQTKFQGKLNTDNQAKVIAFDIEYDTIFANKSRTDIARTAVGDSTSVFFTLNRFFIAS